MKTKWYLLTLVVSLTLLGLGQKEFSVPNQELIVQFSNSEITVEETQATIADLKAQLQFIGADNIQVKEEGSGKLIISYFSTTDTDEVKNILSKEFDLSYTTSAHAHNESGNSSEPISKEYYLDVFEIRNANDSHPISKGIVLDLKTENDRFNKPEIFSALAVSEDCENGLDGVKFTTHQRMVLTIKSPSFKIPEVRAGPYRT